MGWGRRARFKRTRIKVLLYAKSNRPDQEIYDQEIYDFWNLNGGISHCAYCKRSIYHRAEDRHPLRATRDHIEPKRLGGRLTVWACSFCNELKAGMSFAHWKLYMISNPGWWR